MIGGGQFYLLLFGWFHFGLLGFGVGVEFFHILQNDEFWVRKGVLSSFFESNIYDQITAF